MIIINQSSMIMYCTCLKICVIFLICLWKTRVLGWRDVIKCVKKCRKLWRKTSNYHTSSFCNGHFSWLSISILTEFLSLSKFLEQWVPKVLSPNQIVQRADFLMVSLNKIEAIDQFMRSISSGSTNKILKVRSSQSSDFYEDFLD